MAEDKTKEDRPGYEYCCKVMFPVLARSRRIAREIKKRLDAGESLADIHADMRGSSA